MKSTNSDSTCAYTLGLSDDKTFIIVRLKKPFISKITKPFTDETVTFALRRGIGRFLIDARGVSCELDALQTYLLAQDFLQAYLFAQEAENKEGKRFHKLSIVVSQVDDTYAFIETVTRNRGIDTRIFVDFSAAVAWIKG